MGVVMMTFLVWVKGRSSERSGEKESVRFFVEVRREERGFN